jgi:hypothetical protein
VSATYSSHSASLTRPERGSGYPQQAGKKIEWKTQTDFFVAFAGFFALVIGILGISDAISNVLYKGYPILSRGPAILPLVLFGVATAVAWTCSLRAIFRIASLEGSRIVAGGVCQRDLSDMFEMKMPTKRWLYWRIRMWKTSGFAVLCVSLYAAAALTYRLAFTKRDQTMHGIYQNEPSDPLLGCSNWTLYDGSGALGAPRGFLGMFEYLMGAVQAEWPTSPSIFIDASYVSLTNDGWNVQMGWHGLTQASQAPYDQGEGYFNGPHIVGLSQPVSPEDPSRNPDIFIQVANHSQCGPLLQVCVTDGEGCMWIGLGAGIYSATYGPSSGSTYMNDYSFVTYENNCPLTLNTALYDQVVRDFVNDTGMVGLDMFMLPETLLPRKTVYAALLSRLQVNLNMFDDPKSVMDLGILKDPAGTCDGTGGRFNGEFWASNVQTFWPAYQFSSSCLMASWGLLLMCAAYPWKEIIITGSLDQWMSFGADVGKSHMLGACSGRCGSVNEAQWRLRATIDGNSIGRIRLEEKTVRITRTETPVLRFKVTYV